MMNRTRVMQMFVLASSLLFASAACGGDRVEKLPFGLKSEVVATADRVSAMAFAPDGRLFLAEQFSGAIRIVSADGQLQAEPFAQLQVATYIDLDWGLTGLALDPDFESNHFVYAFYTEPASEDGPTGKPKLVRFTEKAGVGTDQKVIPGEFAETAAIHQGYNANGQIHFGQDGFLYLSVGDYDVHADTPEEIRDLGSPLGKLLRIDPEQGFGAPGNPYEDDAEADARVFAQGFREPFPFAVHPESGAIYGTDNTPVTCEELNIIEAGGNYGWPDMGEFPFADCAFGDQVQAIHLFAREGFEPQGFLSFVEVSGLAFAPADKYPQLGESLFVCESHASPAADQTIGPGVLRRLVLTGAGFDQVAASDLIVRDCKGDVAVSPDGTVYYSNNTEVRRLVTAPEENTIPTPVP